MARCGRTAKRGRENMRCRWKSGEEEGEGGSARRRKKKGKSSPLREKRWAQKSGDEREDEMEAAEQQTEAPFICDICADVTKHPLQPWATLNIRQMLIKVCNVNFITLLAGGRNHLFLYYFKFLLFSLQLWMQTTCWAAPSFKKQTADLPLWTKFYRRPPRTFPLSLCVAQT